MTVNNSSIYSNSAVTAGGTFTVGFGTLKLNHVTVTDNRATNPTEGVVKAGGVYAVEGTIEIRNSIIFRNNHENCQIDSQYVTFTVKSGNIIGANSTANCSSNQFRRRSQAAGFAERQPALFPLIGRQPGD